MSIIDKIKQSAARDNQKTQKELYIAEHLPADVDPKMITTFPLYGTLGGVHLNASRAELQSIIDAFPPVDVVLVENSSKSFQPLETSKDERGKLLTVYPIRYDVSEHETEARWYSRLTTGELVYIDVTLTDGKDLFSVYVERDTAFGRNRVRTDYLVYAPAGKNSKYTAVFELRKLGGEVIGWANGGKEYAHSYTVYFMLDNSFNF
jgi:hypothetical protein